MNTQQLLDLLKRTIPASLPVLIESAPGIGKTAVGKQASDQLGRRWATIHASTIDPVDSSGLPLVCEVDGERRYVRCLDDVLDGLVNAKEPTTLLIDELGQAPNAVQAALAPFFAPDRRLNRWTLSPHLSVFGATNTSAHRSAANPILLHIRSRVRSTVRLKVHRDSWIEYAGKTGTLPVIMSFIQSNPTMLYELESLPPAQLKERGLSYDKVFATGEGFTNPRSWSSIDDLLKVGLDEETKEEVIEGAVGSTAALLFMAHERKVLTEIDLDHVLRHDDWEFPPASELGLRWAWTFGLASLATRKNVERVFDIAQKLHMRKLGEYGVVLAQQVVMRDEGLVTSEALRKLSRSDFGRVVIGTQSVKR